jgi:hypothetical protein
MRSFLNPVRTADSPAARLPALDNDEACKRLLREKLPMPAWARVLVQPLPKTTGTMLELDYLHRADNPLGPVLAGKLRWAAADEIGCDYARHYAEADLRKHGGDAKGLDENDRAAVALARTLTRAAHTLTDEEAADLLRRFGPERLVAMVHTVAYANFHNRILLALGVAVEPGGPLPPFDPRLSAEKPECVVTPERPSWEEFRKADAPTGTVGRPDWSERSVAELGNARDGQMAREPRVPVPDDARLAGLPPEHRAHAERVVWSRVSMGYQPRMTLAWFHCFRTFQQESQLDRVFSNSMFWVITRSNECFY